MNETLASYVLSTYEIVLLGIILILAFVYRDKH